MPLIVTPRQLTQRAELYHQLGMMLTAGLSIHKALEHLQSHPPSASLRAPVSKLLDFLKSGLTVGESFRAAGKWTPSFDIALIEAGEKSGRLDACFKLLSNYYRERAQMVQQMISDLMYPAFLFHFSIVVFPFVKLVQSGNYFRFFASIASILIPLYGVIVLIVYACQGKRGEQWRSRLENIFGYVPILGVARRDLALARLATALESLLNAGVPIVTAWELAAAASGSPALGRTVQSWKPSIEAGSSYSEVISKSGQFPDLFANLYHTGEISGTLDDSLLRMHTMYQSEGLSRMRALSQWTPKIIYFGIMLYIAWKIITFYMGYFKQLNDSMKF